MLLFPVPALSNGSLPWRWSPCQSLILGNDPASSSVEKPEASEGNCSAGCHQTYTLPHLHVFHSLFASFFIPPRHCWKLSPPLASGLNPSRFESVSFLLPRDPPTHYLLSLYFCTLYFLFLSISISIHLVSPVKKCISPQPSVSSIPHCFLPSRPIL